MRILFKYPIHGLARVLSLIGHETFLWPQNKPAFDVFAEVEPDLFIGTTYWLDRATAKNICRRPDMWVILHASVCGLQDVPREVRIATEDEKRAVEYVMKNGRIDFLFNNSHGRYVLDSLSGWAELGVNYIGLPHAADVFAYLDGSKNESLECDVSYVGEYSEHAAKYIMPLCSSNKYRVKIMGQNSNWPVHQYLGECLEPDARDLFASSKVSINIAPQYAEELGWGIPERVFQILASGGTCVSNHFDGLRDFFEKEEVASASSADEMLELIDMYTNRYTKRPHRARMKVLLEHTYFERACDIFEELGLERERARVLELKGEVLKGKL